MFDGKSVFIKLLHAPEETLLLRPCGTGTVAYLRGFTEETLLGFTS
jgi:hypothetical protein